MVSFKSLGKLALAALPLAKALPQAKNPISDIVDGLGLPDQVEDVIESISDAVLGILSNPDAADKIPNRYIVVYNNTFDDDTIAKSQAMWSSHISKRNLGKRDVGTGRVLSTEVHAFKMNNWRAMALDAADDDIVSIFNSDEVEYVEADTKVKASATLMQTNAPPGLERISHAARGQKGYVFDSTAGKGITAYVVDTGIRTTHNEFEGRAEFGANFINDVVSFTSPFLSNHGHIREEGPKKGGNSLLIRPRHRIPMRTVTAATSPVPSPAPLSASPRRPTSSPSRSSAPTAAAPTLPSSTACSGSSTTSRPAASRARPS